MSVPPPAQLPPEDHTKVLFSVRYLLPGALVLVGFGFLVFSSGNAASHGFAVFTGIGLSILLLNVLYRFGVRGDVERVDEMNARDYFDEHGHWPDEEPPPQRSWNLPQNVATPESEAAAAESRRREE